MCMDRHALDPNGSDRYGAVRSRWLLRFAVASSAVVVVLSSALIASFFPSGGSSTAASRISAATMPGEPLTVAVARTPGGSLEWRTYVSAIKRMGDAVGRPMRVRYVESRPEMTELLLSGRVDAAFLCTYCYLQVANAPGVSLIAVPLIAGQTKDAAVLVVHADSRYGSLTDLKGRRVGVTDPTSLAGHAYLGWLAERESMDATSSLVLVPADSQEQSIRALLARDVEAVVVNRSQLASWRGSELRVIATSAEFGMPPFVTGATVDTATCEAMRRALLTMRPSAGSATTSIEGFTVPTSSDYDFARVLERRTRSGGVE
jgi:ABC-type phosphate/phosphonate transport system substrate-binding protein